MMSLVYVDVYEITRDTFNLIWWIQDMGVIGKFLGASVRCLDGKITLKNTQTMKKTVTCGVVPRRSVNTNLFLFIFFSYLFI